MNKMMGLLFLGLAGGLFVESGFADQKIPIDRKVENLRKNRSVLLAAQGSQGGVDDQISLDRYDPKDDTKEGRPTSLTISGKAKFIKRNLPKSDPADYFKIKVKQGTYYNFAVMGQETIDTVLSIEKQIGDEYTTIVPNCRDSGEIVAEETETWYLKVSHSSDDSKNWEDNIYTLSAASVNVGTISFSRSEIRVRENTPYVELQVKRSSKNGAVQIKYETENVGAAAGKDYYLTKGVLQWPDGDNKTKKIRVLLIPDVRPTYEEGTKEFKVHLTTVAKSDFELESEFIPVIKGPETATITIQDVDKPNPGVLSFAGYKRGSDSTLRKIVDTKKPVIKIYSSGDEWCKDDIHLFFSRSGGTDGKIGLTYQFLKERRVIEWADGDYEDKEITLTAEDFNFLDYLKLKFSLAKGQYRPKLGTSSVEIHLTSDLVSLDSFVSENRDRLKKERISIQSKGNWGFSLNTHALFCSIEAGDAKPSELSFTFTGPGSIGVGLDPDPKKMEVLRSVDRGPFIPMDSSTLFVPTGKHNVKIIIKSKDITHRCDLPITNSDAGDTRVFAPWYPLEDEITVEYPVNKSVLPLELAKDFCINWQPVYPLGYVEGDSLYQENVYYLFKVYLAEASKKRELLEHLESEFTYYYIGDTKDITVNRELIPGTEYVWCIEVYDPDGKVLLMSNAKKPWAFTVAEKEAPVTTISGRDRFGTPISKNNGLNPMVPIQLIQGANVAFELSADVESAQYSIINGKLPTGLKLGRDGKITGIPTKPGMYQVVLQSKNSSNRIKGTTIPLHFEILALGSAYGKYTGLVRTDSPDQLTAKTLEMGSFTMTASTQGRLTAKVSFGGKSYSFKGNGYETDPEMPDQLIARLTSIQKISGNSYTNEMIVRVPWDEKYESEEDLPYADDDCRYAASEISLKLVIPEETDENVSWAEYHGYAFRDNSKSRYLYPLFTRPYVGYYTVAIPIDEEESSLGSPGGTGYFTLTMNAKGKIKMSGVLADGTKFSSSSVAYPFSVFVDSMVESRYDKVDPAIDCVCLNVPIFYSKKQTIFGGWIQLSKGNDGILWVRSDYSPDDNQFLVWNNDDPKSTYSGKEGFQSKLSPVGCLYTELDNLQAYYLGGDPVVRLSQYNESFPKELLPDGFQLIAQPYGGVVPMAFSGNKIIVEKQKLEKWLDYNGEETEFYAWWDCINSPNLTIRFNRATGIFSGGFNFWAEHWKDDFEVEQQKEVAKAKYQGIVIMKSVVSGPDDPLQCWYAPGFYTLPVKLKEGEKTRTWNGSYPLKITLY